MYGEKEEMCYLMEMYNSETFEFLVMYARSRVGKTTILQEFWRKKNSLIFETVSRITFQMNLSDHHHCWK